MACIFVVDDDELILKSLVRILRRPGHEVVSFISSEQVLPRLAEQPDVLICDYHMPRIDGLQVVAAARRASPRTRTMLLSGGIEDERVAEALATGVLDRFQPKPWHHDELLEALDALLRLP
jgi:CheY-like chemotaxis protein